MSPYLPLVVKMDSLHCLVIGGGAVALRRIQTLLAAGADVTVVSPAVLPEIQQLAQAGRITLLSESYRTDHLRHFSLVIAATDSNATNAQICSDASEKGTLCCNAGEADGGTVLFPSFVQRGDLLIAVTTLGSSPLLAKKIREELAGVYGVEYEKYVALLGEMRQIIQTTIPAQDRQRILQSLLEDSEVFAHVKAGRLDEARERAISCILPLSD
jgi:precorrin-2 dehydrogenase/sirohydrochlorin ferrochelatase